MNQKTKNKLREIFNRHDPISIYFRKEINFDEYDPEISQVLIIFKRSKTKEEFISGIHTLFIRMFDKRIAGPRSRYEKLAREVYDFLRKNLTR